MNFFKGHTFHIPVLGIGYSLDTPVKVAPYGISSVISLVDDALIEEMRKFYSEKINAPFNAISEKVEDFRAKRITAYLDLVDDLVKGKFEEIKQSATKAGSDFEKYLDMLPDFSEIKQLLNDKSRQAYDDVSDWFNEHLMPGSIDVNIMTKLDKANTKNGEVLPVEFNDAHAALRGFANSKLNSGVVFSAGMSPRLYSYLENFKDFFPDKMGEIKKKIILKVSDFRSALIQGKMLAAKGLWISEYRIESGVNCGGHAFPTNGILFGPILEEFRQKRDMLYETCLNAYKSALKKKEIKEPAKEPAIMVTAQGGVGTAEEHNFLIDYYKLDRIGWGSPFMLVPEVVSIDKGTVSLLAEAKEKDLYFSGISPLGVPFNSVKGTTMQIRKLKLAEQGKPGAPCTKQFLKYNTEFTDKPICTASRQYQTKKIAELKARNLPEDEYKAEYNKIIEKECICVGLGVSSNRAKNIPVTKHIDEISVCPGPNIAYFSKEMTLKEMVGHIYGRNNVLDNRPRPHMFLKELGMYLDIYKKRCEAFLKKPDDKKEQKQLSQFRKNLIEGIEYYRNLFNDTKKDVIDELDRMLSKYPVLQKEPQIAEMV
ncbi:MAG: hypothetical protein GXO47_11055 [Chlorobi bacterium]|nr:hypothetical protein [Chlorobiota bacterium]